MICKLLKNRVRRTYKGGTSIDKFTNETVNNSDEYFRPEDWTASVTQAFNGKVEIDGEGLGKTFDGILVREIVKNDLPILVKLLNSEERLVIQAHPTVEFSKKYLNSNYGKTECWYFLDCSPDAGVYLGFKKGISRNEWENAFNNQDVKKMLSLLNRIPVKKGDFVFVAGGVPHAIDKGCFMIELQEPSDLMVVAELKTPSGRIIPKNKVDMGMGYEKMFDVYDYNGYTIDEIKNKYCPTPKIIGNEVYEILGSDLTEKFHMYKLGKNSTIELKRKNAVAIVLDGEGYILDSYAKKGERFLLTDEKTISTKSNKEFEVIICE